MDTQALTKEEEKRYTELQLMAVDMARCGDTAELEKMLIAGLPINLCDTKGNSLLMLAAYNDQAETASMLLKHGAEVDRRNDHGQTPLGGVAFKGNMALVSLLLEAGADINADNGGGKTPLMFAAMFGHREVVEHLLEQGADPDSQTLLGISAQSLAKFTGAFRSLGSLFSK
ncbi:MAG: ankyrin repeat domain-containing protein [Proteobacteria bacterium]|nr:ankyrin repeat domain-containing protein [Pseudomonadota bacterium]MBU1418249.1 ankyrin repeat domain-containing protein [Pseudomonadota bacterium]MBU1453347.1 ankyrin repeat domain-containing protein [Pseudomonadota bacterium]